MLRRPCFSGVYSDPNFAAGKVRQSREPGEIDPGLEGYSMISLFKRFLRGPVPLFIACSLLANSIAYYGTRLITQNLKHYDMTTALDRLIPFIPWTVVIYLVCFAFWFINYALASLQDEADAVRFFSADFMAKVICCICFLLIPTTNIRPEVTGTGFFDNAIRWLYSIDAADNLFPSIHCLTSWFCFISVRKQNAVPFWYKVFSAVLASAVCISTLTTRQHVIVDAVAGVLLAEFSYSWSAKSRLCEWYRNSLLSLYKAIWRKGKTSWIGEFGQ